MQILKIALVSNSYFYLVYQNSLLCCAESPWVFEWQTTMMQAEICLTSFLALDFNSITMLILHLQILISVLPSASKMTCFFLPRFLAHSVYQFFLLRMRLDSLSVPYFAVVVRIGGAWALQPEWTPHTSRARDLRRSFASFCPDFLTVGWSVMNAVHVTAELLGIKSVNIGER